MLGKIGKGTGNFSRNDFADSRAFCAMDLATSPRDAPVLNLSPPRQPPERMTATLMDAMPATRAPADGPAPACGLRPAGAARARLAAYLQRCAAAGIRVVITAPGDVRIFARSLQRFPERQIDPVAHAQWESARRVFLGRGRQPHERGSWHVLAIDSDDRVVGAISARFFCGELVQDYLHVLSLVAACGPVFREHCELAIAEAFLAAGVAERMSAEVSHWSFAPGRQAPLVGATLVRALAALAAAFDAPIGVIAADHHRGEVARLMRGGAAPLGRAGKFSLPPFVEHASGAWLRLLLLDSRTFHARRRSDAAAELAALRAACRVISAG
jgi:hypothetical protein